MLGMPWNLTEMHGWGLLGTHTSLYLIEIGQPPVLFEKPLLNTMRPHVREVIATLMPAYEKMAAVVQANPGKLLSFTDVDVLHGLGNRLTAPMSQHLRGRRNVGVIAFEDTTLEAGEVARGRSYDHMVAHSLYNQKLIRDAGIPDVRLAWQQASEKRQGRRMCVAFSIVFVQAGLWEREAALASFREGLRVALVCRRHFDSVLGSSALQPLSRTEIAAQYEDFVRK